VQFSGQPFTPLLRNDTTSLQRITKQLCAGWTGTNRLVHLRLCERRLIYFVVAVTTVARDIQQNITSERLTVLNCQRGSLQHVRNVFSVDVEHGGSDDLGDI
jgi:hypothetical protein